MSEQDLQQLNSQTDKNVDKKRKKINKIVDVMLWIVIAVLVVSLVVRAFFFTQITVSGESMMTTFHDKEVVSVSKVAKPKRGDVVVFYKNQGVNKFLDIFAPNKSDESKYAKLIKRVVALAGDKLWVEEVDGADNVYRVVVKTPNGEKLYENYYKRNGNVLAEQEFYIKGILVSGSDLGKLSEHKSEQNALVIDEGCFFALGDNRSNSHDSRAFGAVSLSRLYGVVIFD